MSTSAWPGDAEVPNVHLMCSYGNRSSGFANKKSSSRMRSLALRSKLQPRRSVSVLIEYASR